MPACILCDQDNGISYGPVTGKDWSWVKCPRCGVYSFSHANPPDLAGKWKDAKHVLSGVVRDRTERGDTGTELTAESVEGLISTAPVPQTIPEYVDGLLLYLARRLDRPWLPVSFNKERDYPLLFMKNAEDMNGFLGAARDMGLLEARAGGEWRFSTKGWERVELLRAAQPKSRHAFVAMWFDKSLDEAWDQGFRPGIEDSGYFKAVRSDRAEFLGKVDDWIIARIRRSGLVVADFTGNRSGVYYEAGFAQALNIPVVFTCHEDHMEDVHFDTNHFNHIVWTAPEDLRQQLNDRIIAVVLPQTAKRTGS